MLFGLNSKPLFVFRNIRNFYPVKGELTFSIVTIQGMAEEVESSAKKVVALRLPEKEIKYSILEQSEKMPNLSNNALFRTSYSNLDSIYNKILELDFEYAFLNLEDFILNPEAVSDALVSSLGIVATKNVRASSEIVDRSLEIDRNSSVLSANFSNELNPKNPLPDKELECDELDLQAWVEDYQEKIKILNKKLEQIKEKSFLTVP
jgi:hypothetical protein